MNITTSQRKCQDTEMTYPAILYYLILGFAFIALFTWAIYVTIRKD
jgi:hypothetical protein